MNAKKQLKKALKEIEALRKAAKAETNVVSEDLPVTGMTASELEMFYDMCEKITMFQSVIENQGLNEPENIADPNLQLSCEHFIQQFRKDMWSLYYTLEDRQDISEWNDYSEYEDIDEDD